MIREILTLLAGWFRRPATPEDGWAGLMEAYQRMEQQLQQRIEQLENRLASLEAALDTEKSQHAECRRRLSEHENKLARLQARVDHLTREVDGGS